MRFWTKLDIIFEIWIMEKRRNSLWIDTTKAEALAILVNSSSPLKDLWELIEAFVIKTFFGNWWRHFSKSLVENLKRSQNEIWAGKSLQKEFMIEEGYWGVCGKSHGTALVQDTKNRWKWDKQYFNSKIQKIKTIFIILRDSFILAWSLKKSKDKIILKDK